MSQAKGIPTLYNGVQFRSRLEAKWAAFFDLLGWRWEYEPFDLNGWIPDFVLIGSDDVLAEVKPVTSFPQDVADKIDEAHKLYATVDDDGDPGPPEDGNEVLILGCTISVMDDYSDAVCLGWLRDCGWWERAMLGNRPGSWDFCHELGAYKGRMTSHYDGSQITGGSSEAIQLWRTAGSRVQWKGPQRRVTTRDIFP